MILLSSIYFENGNSSFAIVSRKTLQKYSKQHPKDFLNQLSTGLFFEESSTTNIHQSCIPYFLNAIFAKIPAPSKGKATQKNQEQKIYIWSILEKEERLAIKEKVLELFLLRKYYSPRASPAEVVAKMMCFDYPKSQFQELWQFTKNGVKNYQNFYFQRGSIEILGDFCEEMSQKASFLDQTHQIQIFELYVQVLMSKGSSEDHQSLIYATLSSLNRSISVLKQTISQQNNFQQLIRCLKHNTESQSGNCLLMFQSLTESHFIAILPHIQMIYSLTEKTATNCQAFQQTLKIVHFWLNFGKCYNKLLKNIGKSNEFQAVNTQLVEEMIVKKVSKKLFEIMLEEYQSFLDYNQVLAPVSFQTLECLSVLLSPKYQQEYQQIVMKMMKHIIGTFVTLDHQVETLFAFKDVLFHVDNESQRVSLVKANLLSIALVFQKSKQHYYHSIVQQCLFEIEIYDQSGQLNKLMGEAEDADDEADENEANQVFRE